jgi:hydroxymethylpyrimidine/phosphomethylpyrimidine kinase
MLGSSNLTLTIAGSDPSGGAGLQADLGVFARHGLRGAGVVTALTVQSAKAVRSVHPVDSARVVAQLRAVLEDHAVAAAKLGMLGSAETSGALAAVWRELGADIPLVIDPVLVSSSGLPLLGPGGLVALRDELLPLARVITPNLPEAAALLGLASSAADGREAMEMARALVALGPDCVVVTGGHAKAGATADEIVDVVAFATGEALELRGPRVLTAHTHGTGCLFSAGITAALARGASLRLALHHGRACVTRGLQAGCEGAVWLDAAPSL